MRRPDRAGYATVTRRLRDGYATVTPQAWKKAREETRSGRLDGGPLRVATLADELEREIAISKEGEAAPRGAKGHLSPHVVRQLEGLLSQVRTRRAIGEGGAPGGRQAQRPDAPQALQARGGAEPSGGSSGAISSAVSDAVQRVLATRMDQLASTVRDEVRREMMQQEQQLSALAQRTEDVRREQQRQLEEVRQSLDQLAERMEIANEQQVRQVQVGPAAHGGWECYAPR